MRRIIISLALTLFVALAAAGCGSDHDDTDVTFARSMIPHHEQAVEMAKLASTRAADPRVKALASQIQAAQGPEITTMKGWLSGWGEDAGSASDMDHGMPGMMSDDEMAGLERATGTSFDAMFLTMMIGHHEGAVSMARTERSDGKSSEVKALARKIAKGQTAEIATMKRLLGQ